MIKTYKCPVHGEFNLETDIKSLELKHCPKCNGPVTRVYKPTGYSFHTEGFCGKGFSIPNYK